MKKCPYCYTLMNDDIKTCPNCLKDMSNLSPMKEVASKDNKLSFYSLVFGLIISLGSIIASLSLRQNRMHFQESYDECKASFDVATNSSVKDSLASQGDALMVNIKTCLFREVAFYIMCGIGGVLIIYAIIKFIIDKTRKRKKIKN